MLENQREKGKYIERPPARSANIFIAGGVRSCISRVDGKKEIVFVWYDKVDEIGVLCSFIEFIESSISV